MINPNAPDYSNTPVSAERPSFSYQPADLNAPPVVSLLTPFFNTGPVFHETAQSILRQSLQQWEWLIINDGSTDPAALATLDYYRGRDPRIRVIDHPVNRGLSAARNTGFQAARSEYVAQVDSDDLIEPTALETWRWALESFPERSFVKGYSIGFGAQQYLWTAGFHSRAELLNYNVVDATAMIRKSVHAAVGGYDEALRAGLEDWDFWLKCAQAGYWGSTVPEFQDWYRRRPNHADRWAEWNNRQKFQANIRQRYPRLFEQGFPLIPTRPHRPHETISDVLPWSNTVASRPQRLLMLLPWMTMGGADKFNLDLLGQLTRRGWEVTIATTLTGDNSWMPEFARLTPDIFVLPHFLHLADYPRFLRYLISSRGAEALVITNSEFGYLLLPYLRAHFPHLPMLDFVHMEEEQYKNGGYARSAVESQPLLDLNVVSSRHLQDWMSRRGSEPERIRVCSTNIDAEHWRPDPAAREAVRRELGVAPGKAIILYAARLCAQKQPLVFAETMRLLRDQGLSFLAVVAGDGPDRKILKHYLEANRLQSLVRLLGALSNEKTRRLMQAADIFFLPSQMEGIALSVFEAMACGLAVVGADVGGQRELVLPECGVLISPSDPQAEAKTYAEVLADLIRDAARRQALSTASRARVAGSFQLDQMGDQMEACLAEAKELNQAALRPAVSLGLGRAAAGLAVEYTRLGGQYDGLALAGQAQQALQLPAARAVSRAGDDALARRLLEQSLRWDELTGDLAHAVAVGGLFAELGLAADARKLLPPMAAAARQTGNHLLAEQAESLLKAGPGRAARRSAGRAGPAQAPAPGAAAPPTAGPLVSVIIPTYNRPSQLRQALQSVAQQTYTNVEIIVVNDGGQDVGKLVRRFKSRRPIVYEAHATNRGAGAARNTGLRAAHGDYVAFLDDDDLYLPRHLALLVAELENSSDIVAAYADASQVTKSSAGAEERSVIYSVDFSAEELRARNYIPVLCLMARAAALQKSGLFDETMDALEDWEWLIRLSQVAPFRHVLEVTAEYTVRQGTPSRNILSPEQMQALYIKVYTAYAGHTTPAVRQAQRRIYAQMTGRDLAADAPELFQAAPQPVAAPGSNSAESVVNALLSSHNLVQTLQEHLGELDAQVVNLLRERSAQAQGAGELEAAAALDQLAAYVQQLAEAATEPAQTRAHETLQLLLGADDVVAALERYGDRLDGEVLALVELNERTARTDGELELADGLQGLSQYIASRLAAVPALA